MAYKPKLNAEQKKFVEKFKKAGTYFFVKKMTRNTIRRLVAGKYGYALEFPQEFITNHVEEFTNASILVSKSRDPQSTRVWPFHLTYRCMGDGSRLFAYGNGGWKQFVVDNNLHVGDIVVFQLVGFAKFRAYIWREDLIRHG